MYAPVDAESYDAEHLAVSDPRPSPSDPGPRPTGGARVEVLTEREVERGWEHQVRVETDCGDESEHTVRLDWADHDRWSGGRCPPSRVSEALVLWLVTNAADRPLPERFDASTARRWYPDLDGAMPGLV